MAENGLVFFNKKQTLSKERAYFNLIQLLKELRILEEVAPSRSKGQAISIR